MKNQCRVVGILSVLSLLAMSSAKAEEVKAEPRWELWTGSLADFTKTFDSKIFSGGFLGGHSAVPPSVGYFVSKHVEILLSPSFNFQSSGNYLGRFMLGVGGNFLSESVRTSYFAKVMVGFDDILDNKTSDNPHLSLNTFVWSVSAGKRIEITPSISYSPELNFTTVYDAYSAITSYSIVPLQFNLFL